MLIELLQNTYLILFPIVLKNKSSNQLDDLPYPSWDKTFKYGGPRAFFISLFQKTIPILYSRGCPLNVANEDSSSLESHLKHDSNSLIPPL